MRAGSGSANLDPPAHPCDNCRSRSGDRGINRKRSPTYIMFKGCSPCLTPTKQGTGSSQSPKENGNHTYRTLLGISEDNWNAEQEDSDTGSSWSPSPRRKLFDRPNSPFLTPPTWNPQDHLLPQNTYGNLKQGLEKYFKTNKAL